MKNDINRLRTIFGAAVILALVLFAFEEFLFGQPNTKFMLTAQESGPFLYILWLISLIAGLFLNIYWFWWSLRAKTPFRILYGALFVIGVLIQYGYWNVLHRLVEPSDIALLGVTSTQAWKDSYRLYFSWWGVLVCIPYVSALFLWRKDKQTEWKEFVFCLGAIISLSIILASFNVSYKLGASFTEIIESLSIYIVSDIKPVTRELIPALNVTPPQQNIVFIIDEGIRSDHLSVNGYSRETTPWFDILSSQGTFYSWGYASAGATCSPISNKLMLTGIIPSAKASQDVDEAPTIFQYAQAAGYKSYYIDAQTNYLWNGLSPAEIQSIKWINTDTLGHTPEADLNAARMIREIVTQSTGNFIVLNKRGVHFMYEDSYPQDAVVWRPLPPNQDYRGFPELVSNPYDNGILYTVNGFFKILLPDTKTFQNTWYIYTSDHAQTLFEDGMTWSHCNNSVKEATVPLIMMGNFQEPPDTSYPASHSNILPTILDLMDFPASQAARQYNFSLLTNGNPHLKRYFIDGAIRVIPFDK